MQHRLNPVQRELEHHAASSPRASRPAATGRRAIEIAAAVGNQATWTSPVAAAGKGIKHLLGPVRRELEHHAAPSPKASRPAAIGRRAIEIAAAVGNQVGIGVSPIAGTPRKGVQHQHRLGPALRKLEHDTISRRAAKFGCAIEIAAAVGNQAGLGISPVAGAARKGVQHRLGWRGQGAAPRRRGHRQRGGRKSRRQ